MKSRITIIVLLVALVIVSTLGAMAYFSSTADGSGTIKSGSLTLYLSTDNTSWGKTVNLPWSAEEMAPGDRKAGYLYLYNAGTIAAKSATFDFKDLVNNPANIDLARNLFITDIRDNFDAGNQISAFETYDNSDDGNISLYELAVNTPDGYSPTDTSITFLPAGGTGWLYMEVMLNPAVDNTFQNVRVTYNLTVKANQTVWDQPE